MLYFYSIFTLQSIKQPVKNAVYGMLPKDKSRRNHMKRLFIFPDGEHPYAANIYKDYESGEAVTLNQQLESLALEMEGTSISTGGTESTVSEPTKEH